MLSAHGNKSGDSRLSGISRLVAGAIGVFVCASYAAQHSPAEPSAAPSHPTPRPVDGDEDWASFRGDAERSGVRRRALPARLELLWKFQMPDSVLATAAIADNTVFVGGADGVLYALNLDDGKPRWTSPTTSRIQSSAAVSGGLVLFGDDDGVFRAVFAHDGKIKWEYKTGGEIVSSPIVHADRAWFGSYDENLYCLRVDDGALLWKYATAGRLHGSPSLFEGHVLIAGCDESLHVVKQEDGSLVRKVALGSMSGSTAAVSGSIVVVGTYGNQVEGLNWREGKSLWAFEDPQRGFPFLSSAAMTPEAAFIGGRDKQVRRFETQTGRVVWTFSARGRVDSSPVLCGSTLYFGSTDGIIYGVDVDKGVEIWRYETGSPITASPAVARGRLVIGNEEGALFCFGSKSSR